MSVQIHIGSQITRGNVYLAPMAGITDLPFRKLCRRLGAAYAVGEMTASQEQLKNTPKTRNRMEFSGEELPRSVQLIGSDPQAILNAALRAKEAGATVIDFNCGCPAKKVCSVACGSALLRDPPLIERIIATLVDNVGLPVTLKYRTGWSDTEKNALQIGEMAQKAGASLLTLHGRTREQGFKGQAEYETIKRLKSAVDIPVIANGDIDSAEKALEILGHTEADGVMIGRASFGRPWIFSEIEAAVGGLKTRPLTVEEKAKIVFEHLDAHFSFYGVSNALRSFRKHLNWYLPQFGATDEDIREIYKSQSQEALVDALIVLFKRLNIAIPL